MERGWIRDSTRDGFGKEEGSLDGCNGMVGNSSG